MFTPTVIESSPALEAVARDPFMDSCDAPSEPSACEHRRAPVAKPIRVRRGQRALVEASLLYAPGRDEPTSRRWA
jgi:hypothetical protein